MHYPYKCVIHGYYLPTSLGCPKCRKEKNNKEQVVMRGETKCPICGLELIQVKYPCHLVCPIHKQFKVVDGYI
jgi:transcription elongation factor Elf1